MKDLYPKGEYVTSAGLVSAILEALVADITSDLEITGFFPNNGTFQSQSCIAHDR